MFAWHPTLNLKVTRDLDKDLEQYKGLKVAVLWSGGIDSTFLISKLLRLGINVQAIAIDYNLFPAQAIQKLHRNKLLETFKEFNNFKLTEVSLNVTNTTVHNKSPNTHIGQSRQTLLTAYMCLDYDVDVVMHGVAMEDPDVSFIDECIEEFKHLVSNKYITRGIAFPLVKTGKPYKDFPSEEQFWTWTCEVITATNYSKLAPFKPLETAHYGRTCSQPRINFSDLKDKDINSPIKPCGTCRDYSVYYPDQTTQYYPENVTKRLSTLKQYIDFFNVDTSNLEFKIFFKHGRPTLLVGDHKLDLLLIRVEGTGSINTFLGINDAVSLLGENCNHFYKDIFKEE